MAEKSTVEKNPEPKQALDTIKEALKPTGLQFLDARKSPALDGDVYTIRVLDKRSK